jgi:single-strand DNA-binding protein
MSLNRVCLIGRLGRDPELRTTNTGKSVVEFSIAVSKRIKPQDGGPDADWFRVKAWGNTAEFVANYLGKGRLVAVDGRLETRKWTDNEGNNREIIEVVAEQVQSLERPRDDQPADPRGDTQRAPTSGGGDVDEYDPFADE